MKLTYAIAGNLAILHAQTTDKLTTKSLEESVEIRSYDTGVRTYYAPHQPKKKNIGLRIGSYSSKTKNK